MATLDPKTNVWGLDRLEFYQKHHHNINQTKSLTKQLLIWTKMPTFKDKFNENHYFRNLWRFLHLVPPSVFSGGHLSIDRLFDSFLKT